MEVEELRDIVREMNQVNMELVRAMQDMNERIKNLETASKAMMKIIESLIGIKQIPIQHTCTPDPDSEDICPACLIEREKRASGTDA